jgi:hypothetical protein
MCGGGESPQLSECRCARERRMGFAPRRTFKYPCGDDPTFGPHPLVYSDPCGAKRPSRPCGTTRPPSGATSVCAGSPCSGPRPATRRATTATWTSWLTSRSARRSTPSWASCRAGEPVYDSSDPSHHVVAPRVLVRSRVMLLVAAGWSEIHRQTDTTMLQKSPPSKGGCGLTVR